MFFYVVILVTENNLSLQLRDSYRTIIDASDSLGGGNTAEMLERMMQSASYGAQLLEAAAVRQGQVPSHSMHGQTHTAHGHVPSHGTHGQTHGGQVHGQTHSVQGHSIHSATPSPQETNEPEEPVKEVHVDGAPSKRQVCILFDFCFGAISIYILISSSQKIRYSNENIIIQKMEDGVQEGQTCLGCSATSTPEWRRGPMGPRTLCNACGLVYAKLVRGFVFKQSG